MTGRRADAEEGPSPQAVEAPSDADTPALARGADDDGRWRAARRMGRLSTLLDALLVLGIVLLGNYLAYRHYERFDLTAQGVFTLSERSVEELRALTKPVEVYLFLSAAEANFPEVSELLDRFEAESSRLSVHRIDPHRQPAEFRTVAQRFGLGAAVLESGETVADVAAVVTSGDERWTITRDDMMGIDFGSFDDAEGPRIDVKAEQAMLGAIVQVTSGRRTKICATTGHGEWSLEPGSERSLWALKDELKRDNLETEPLETLGLDEVPASCDAVFVISPIRSFTEEEATMLAAFVRSGGSLLLALDPVIERDRIQSTGFEGMAESFGIQIDSSLVLERDASRLLQPDPRGPFLVTDYGEHRTTEHLAAVQLRSVLYMARSVRPMPDSAASVLLRSSEHAFAETDIRDLEPGRDMEIGDGDIVGPVDLAVAVELDESGRVPSLEDEMEDDGAPAGGRHGRLIVLGDADLLMGDFLESPQFANFDLASAFTGWLTQRDTLIAIAPKQIRAQPMLLTEDDLSGLLFRVMVLMPAAVIMLGFAVWWSRRS